MSDNSRSARPYRRRAGLGTMILYFSFCFFRAELSDSRGRPPGSRSARIGPHRTEMQRQIDSPAVSARSREPPADCAKKRYIGWRAAAFVRSRPEEMRRRPGRADHADRLVAGFQAWYRSESPIRRQRSDCAVDISCVDSMPADRRWQGACACCPILMAIRRARDDFQDCRAANPGPSRRAASSTRAAVLAAAAGSQPVHAENWRSRT